ncbi:DEK domain-containing chromatin-associated protein 4-like [Phragmites australis]|uniref:DEK domain-containing chromatin-associated protein 4-like n=1 Tax=Phragmites australis TaxID=29695 RepID=UPI002D79AA7D|nr:DEK domain-containing chromatin-associated protein 4-like [Phragmites australis]
MDCVDGASASTGAGEDRSKVASEIKLIKQTTWVFVEKESVTDLRERILQLAGHACHEEEERTELLEKLNSCKRDTLIELCRSFDIIGSRANRKEELVSFLMKFSKDHCSGIDGTNPYKKIKKRKRIKEEVNLSSSKPSKKKKREGTALETQGEEEAEGRKVVEDRINYSDCDLMNNRYVCADNKKGKFPNEEANLEPSKRINGSTSENLDGVTLNEAPIPTNVQALITTPSANLVTATELDSTNMKTSKKKKCSVTKKKATPKEDHQVKSCVKLESKGDSKPRKQALKPSRDELREAIFLILDTADFATMTFGEVVKKVDKYFGKDLFEIKPLIRSLIEEELFRLAEEAETKELEEEEAAEAKARAEQAAKARAKDRTVESGVNKRNELQAGQGGKIKDTAKNTNGNTTEKGFRGGTSVEAADNGNSSKAADNGNSSKAAESSQDGQVDADTKNGNNGDEFTEDGKSEKVAPNINGDYAIQGSRIGKAETVKNKNVDSLQVSKDGKLEVVSKGENDDTEDDRAEEGRSGNSGNNAEDFNGCEAEDCNSHENDERVECAEDGKTQEANNNENS